MDIHLSTKYPAFGRHQSDDSETHADANRAETIHGEVVRHLWGDARILPVPFRRYADAAGSNEAFSNGCPEGEPRITSATRIWDMKTASA